MRFMMLMIPKGYEKAAPGTMPDAKAVAAMMKYNEDLQKAGVLLALDGLHPPSMGARVSFSGGKPKVTDGPFTETKEVLGGYWMIQVKSKEEAIEWASRCPGRQRNDRDPPGAGDVGLSARRAEGGGGVFRDAGEGERVIQANDIDEQARRRWRKREQLSLAERPTAVNSALHSGEAMHLVPISQERRAGEHLHGRFPNSHRVE